MSTVWTWVAIGCAFAFAIATLEEIYLAPIRREQERLREDLDRAAATMRELVKHSDNNRVMIRKIAEDLTVIAKIIDRTIGEAK